MTQMTTQPESEIVLSGEPTYGNGTYSQVASTVKDPSDDMQRQIADFVKDHTYGETEPTPVIRTGTISGGFADDTVLIAPAPQPRRFSKDNNHRTNPKEKRNESQDAGIDPNKTFFITEGAAQGGMRMNWETWKYIRRSATTADETDSPIIAVDVTFPSNRTVRLTGKDAYNFLKIVGDRNAEAFSRQRELN